MPAFSLSQSIENKWGWLLGTGILMVALGVLAILFVGVTSVLSVIYLGAFFMIAGIAEVIYGIRTREHSDMWYHIFFGALFAVAGYFIFTNPIANLFFLTLLIAMVLLVSGAVYLVGALVERFHNWGWFALNGVVAIAASYLIFRNPYASSFWLIGVLVGCEMLLRGMAWISLGLTGRALAKSHSRPGYSSQRPITV
jgi:uncharacterized membrane protein HdeD (DUF308 family)